MSGTTGSWTPDPDLTMKQFADAIRAKYPKSQMYKDKSDEELSKAYINSSYKNDVYKKRIKDWPTEYPITPKEGESFQDTMKRAATAGKQNVSADGKTFVPPKGKEKDYTGTELLKKMGIVLTAAPVIGAGGAAAIAGSGIAAKRIFVDEIIPKIVKGQVVPQVQKALIKQVVEHLSKPGTILKTPYGRAMEYYLLGKLGVGKGDIAKIMKALD